MGSELGQRDMIQKIFSLSSKPPKRSTTSATFHIGKDSATQWTTTMATQMGLKGMRPLSLDSLAWTVCTLHLVRNYIQCMRSPFIPKRILQMIDGRFLAAILAMKACVAERCITLTSV